MKESATTAPRRTGFLDLPVELRRIIYPYMLPSARTLHFPNDQNRLDRLEQKEMFAVCAAHETISDEMEEEIYKGAVSC